MADPNEAVKGGDDVASTDHASRHLTTGDMARLSTSTLRTVRFYEEEGILRPIARSEGGHRLFEPEELERLQLVLDMRAAGLSLGEIKELLALKQSARSGGEAAKLAAHALGQRITELDGKLAALMRLREDLVQTSDIVVRCEPCEGHELFPEDCDRCAMIISQQRLPRGFRVLWSISAKRPADEEEPKAKDPSDAESGERA